VEEVPRCHLHRKANKACKFCKSYANFLDQRNKENEDRRNAALERFMGTGASNSRAKDYEKLREDDKVPVPNLVHFPQVLKERILSDRFFTQVLANSSLSEIRNTIFSCDTCEPEIRGSASLDTSPSPFFCCVFRMLTLKLTEGQLQGLLNNRSRWVRCAGFLYVRLGVHFDRYWELLSDALMDPEEFVPYPDRGSESMSEGQFVEQLLTKEKYCDFSLPRLAAAQRRVLNERLVLYEQFRQRYAAHLDKLDRFEDPDGGIPVEVCTVDGEWLEGRTAGPPTTGRRRVCIPVNLAQGVEQQVSIGMLICPGMSPNDLTTSRGKTYQELLEKYREQQRESAVASGRDYCKSSGRHTIHAGGQTFICGEKRGRDREDEEATANLARDAKRSTPSLEQEMKMAAIMEKYCASSRASAQGRSQNQDGIEGPERLRLG